MKCKKIMALALAAALSVGMLAGCGRDDDSSSTPAITAAVTNVTDDLLKAMDLAKNEGNEYVPLYRGALTTTGLPIVLEAMVNKYAKDEDIQIANIQQPTEITEGELLKKLGYAMGADSTGMWANPNKGNLPGNLSTTGSKSIVCLYAVDANKYEDDAIIDWLADEELTYNPRKGKFTGDVMSAGTLKRSYSYDFAAAIAEYDGIKYVAVQIVCTCTEATTT